MRLEEEHVRDLVAGKGTNRLLIARVADPLVGGLGGSFALLDRSGQLLVEMGSIAELSVGGLLLRCRRTGVHGEIRRLEREE
jgi:hypothetical protein